MLINLDVNSDFSKTELEPKNITPTKESTITEEYKEYPPTELLDFGLQVIIKGLKTKTDYPEKAKITQPRGYESV